MAFRNLVPWKKREGSNLAKAQENDPFSMLQREMNRLFENFGRGFDMAPFEGEGEWMPRVNVSQTDKDVTVSAELPGIKEEDVNVSVTRDLLTISGQKVDEHEDKQKDYFFAERTYGSFERSIQLPAEVDSDKADAKFSKGVLTITLPKKAEQKPDAKKISVKSQQ